MFSKIMFEEEIVKVLSERERKREGWMDGWMDGGRE